MGEWDPIAAGDALVARMPKGRLDLGYKGRSLADALKDAPGGPEALLSMGTGMVGGAVGGIDAGIMAALGGSSSDVENRLRDTSQALTYEPRSDAGKGILQMVQPLLSLPRKAAHWVGEHAQDAGLPAGLAAALTTGLEWELGKVPGEGPAPVGEMAALLKKRSPAARDRFLAQLNDLSLPQALEVARAEPHLKVRDEGGQYLGAPPGIDSPAKLRKLRAHIDALIDEGAHGQDWYEQARNATRSISNDELQASELGLGYALHSPATTPDVAMGRTHQQVNQFIAGAEGKLPGMGGGPKLDKVLKEGPQAIQGTKVSNFGRSMVPGEKWPNVSVNDLWQGRAYGYKNSGVNTDTLFERGFEPHEHAFQAMENLLAMERAAKRGTLQPGAEGGHVGRAQASMWTAMRERSGLSAEKARESNEPLLDKYTANETYETVPGRGSGHLAGAADLPFESKKALADALKWNEPGGKDPVYGALRMPQRGTTEGLGQFAEQGKVDYNPNTSAHPMVSVASGGRALNEPDAALITQANALRSVVDAQAAGAHNMGSISSGNAGNAAKVRFKKALSPEETRALYDKVGNAGLNLVNNGGGSFTVTEDFGKGNATSFGKKLRAMGELPGADVERAGYIGGYQEVPWGKEKSGVTTDWLLKNVKPEIGGKLQGEGLAKALRGKNDAEMSPAVQKLGLGAPRDDLHRLREMIASHGVEGLRAMVKKAGGGVKGAAKLGLPAVALSYLDQEEQ